MATRQKTDQAKQLLAEVGVRDRRAFLYVFMSSIGAQVIGQLRTL
jgi:hypothetical protein